MGWIVDLRWTGGGVPLGLSCPLLDHGLIFSRQRHNAVYRADGTLLYPHREDFAADGTALAFQRPLQAHGRATLVGERTAGLCGSQHSVELAPGWHLLLAARETVFGPQQLRFNRVGVPPDLQVTPSAADEAAGRDLQLAVAVQVLCR